MLTWFFVTKYRHHVFAETHLKRMEEIVRAVCADFETEPVEFNGEANHVHLLVNFPPKVTISTLTDSLNTPAVDRDHAGAAAWRW
jgi:putative transposase